MILQLAKTSPYLTGQFKLDIELLRNAGDTVTGDCHASSLSDNLGETDSLGVPFFNCEISDHIKRMWSRMGDDFFKDSPVLNSTKILYEDPDSFTDKYDHTYQSGVSRMRYEKYHKQFQLLCPVWVDDLNDFNNTSFIIKIRGRNSGLNTTETRIVFSEELKDKIRNYLYEINQDLLNINFDRNEVTIKGLDVEHGTVITKEVSYSLQKMLDRERPIIETDSMLCQLLPSNKMVARQVLNLNFCFNIADIFPQYLSDEFNLKQWTIWCDMEKNTDGTKEEVEFKDLYTNYTDIPSFIADNENGHFTRDKNALDYLEDNNCIDYIFTNKLTQPIFHWSLAENQNYLYNFYNGFSPLVEKSDVNSREYLGAGLFFNQPNPYKREYAPGSNTLNWCKVLDFSGLSGINLLLSSLVPSSFTHFTRDSDTKWINGMKFDFSALPETFDLYINIILIDSAQKSVIANDSDLSDAVYTDKPIFYHHRQIGDILAASLLVDSSNKNELSAVSLYDIIGNMTKNNVEDANSDSRAVSGSAFTVINKMFAGYVYPWTISYNKSLYAERIDSPEEDSKEITYYKSDININSEIYRYTGNLIPMTIKASDDPISSNYYNKDFFLRELPREITDDFYAKYNEYLKTGYQQAYPSIGYFPLEETDAAYVPDSSRYPYWTEVKWHKSGRVYNLPERIELTVYDIPVPASGSSVQDTAYSSLYNYFNRKYDFTHNSYLYPEFNKAWENQLKKLYDYKISSDYMPGSISTYKLDITYNLR